METAVRGILFDAGDTLTAPKSGHWFISPGFADITRRYGLLIPQDDRLFSAFAPGLEYLDYHHSIMTEDEELAQFGEFYRIILQSYFGTAADSTLVGELARDMVCNDDKYEFYEDVEEVLGELSSRGYVLGVVSNTWPSLERVFRHRGLYDFFRAFIISSRVGCYKPEPRIFHVAIDAMGMSPDTLLFVDDFEGNVCGGEKLGMRGVVIDRYHNCSSENHVCIHSLRDLIPLLA